MQEDVLNFNTTPKMVIDHINHNPLDNRKQNLRICTAQQNCRNRGPSRNKTGSKYKCIHYRDNKAARRRKAARKVWLVRIAQAKKSFSEGFVDEKDAYRKSQEMLKKYHGEFAYLVPWSGYSNCKYPNKPINYKPPTEPRP